MAIRRVGRWTAAILSLMLATGMGAAQAGEGIFGFVYTLDLQPKGKWEFEQRVDTTHGQAVGSYNLTKLRSELEYGLTNDVQVAAYLNAVRVQANNNYLSPETCVRVPCTAGFGVPSARNNQDPYNRKRIDGASAEVIWRITNPVTSPVGVGVYFEPTFGQLEDELEYRLILQSNFLDDRLIFAANGLVDQEKEKYAGDGIIRNTMLDLLYGVSYRLVPKWSAGIEGRWHHDSDGYFYNTHTQTANFIGPTVHYAARDFWASLTWRRQISGRCYADGTADCSQGKVWDNHGRNQYLLKVGIPLN